MLIQVKYPDNRYDFVKEFMLGNLIETGRITGFRRSGGWVSVEDDLIRREHLHTTYTGFEKRAASS